MRRYVIFAVSLAMLAMGGCNTERARLAKVPVVIEVKRFEQMLLQVNENNFDQQIMDLQAEYGEFFTLFCDKIIAVGTPDSTDFKNQLFEFLHDTIVQDGYRKSQEVFADTKTLNETFTLAFKRFYLHFPAEKIPQVYTYVSGFNQSVILAEDVIAIGLDKYLGAEYPLYTQMGFYRYLSRNMYPAKLPADAIRCFASAMFSAPTADLLQTIIWEGKLLYFTKQLLPDEPDTCLFGFTAQHIKSCLDNEAYMWSVLIDNQLLFSQSPRIIRDMTQEAPFTVMFSQEAPGRAAVWIGYRIVEKYMRNNSNVTLPQLMQNCDAQAILDGARYNP
jgi:hypothetical protein